jgi:sec-independent protein translocase protein TatA
MFNNIGAQELIIILLILLFLFGATKLPALAKGLGKSVKEFKKGMNEEEEKAPPADETPKPPETK